MKLWLIIGAVNGFLAVACGAFGAHGLEARLTANGRAANWETAASYHMYHAIAMLAGSCVASRAPEAMTNRNGACFLGGFIFFCGCLYALALTNIKVLGAITPIGGVLFLVGWVLLAVSALKMK